MAGSDPARLLPFRPVDRMLLGYLAVVSVIALVRLEVRPRAGWVLAANALTAVLVYLLRDPRQGRWGRLIREIYPIMLLPALYGALDLLNGLELRTWDPLVRSWEEALFGTQVSRIWWQTAPSAFWSTLLHAAYFGYYIIIPLPLIWFLGTGRTAAGERVVAMIVATFLICYVIFLLFPVAGPYYEFPRPTGPFVDNWAARLVYGTLAQGSSYGAAFPSSHVAATIVAAIGAGLGSRRLGLALALPTLLLTVGVVYCQMHYAVDALAGVVLAVAVAWAVARWLPAPQNAARAEA